MHYAFIAGSCLLAAVSAAPVLDARNQEPAVITVNGNTCTPDSSGNYVIGTQTLVPGGPAITVGNVPVSLFPSATAVLINGVSTPLKTAQQPVRTENAAPLTFHGATYTPNALGGYVINGKTLVPGGAPITIDNTPLSLFPKATALLQNGVPTPLSAAPSMITPGPKIFTSDDETALPCLSFHGKTYTADSEGHFTIEGNTLSPGGAPITVDSTPLSLFPSATAVMINGAATPLAMATPQPDLHSSIGASDLPVIALSGQDFTANNEGNYLIYGNTLIPGGPAITVDNTPLSLFPSATALLMNGYPTPLAAARTTSQIGGFQKAKASFTFHGSVYTSDAHGDYVCGSNTLVPGGPAITIDHTPVSLFPSATAILSGGKPTPL
jgi:hypothetical protein